MDRQELIELEHQGWHLTRDGSTATARFNCDDPEDPDSGWELLVLHTAGHGCRFTVNVFESGLTERRLEDASRFHQHFTEARRLLEAWGGDLPDENA
jgi:hypothetical protein